MVKIIAGINDLFTTNPELEPEWDVEKNTVNPKKVTAGSHKRVWWRCSKGHSWEAYIRDRADGRTCPYCSNVKLLSGFNDLATVNPDVAKEWNYERNGDLKPDQVKFSANTKVWWKCSQGHEWEAYVFNRCDGHGCPYCTNRKVLRHYNDLETLFPDIAKEWNYDKNKTLIPSKVLSGSHRKVWWICTKGHEWKAEIKSRTEGQNCPYCGNKKVLSGFNDLVTTNPELVEEWNHDKNSIQPTEVTAGSSKKVWWMCSNGHEWQAVINSRVSGKKCPYCTNNKVLAGYNDLRSTHPNIANEWDYKKNKIKPEEVLAGSNIAKYWFVCPKGHSYKTTLLSRKAGTGCPICAMEKHTSFPEKAIFYYFRQAISDTKENYRNTFLGAKEIDIFLPKLRIGIEYDGAAWHKDYKRDKEKDNVCEKNGIKMFRVREKGCFDYSSDSTKIYVEPYNIDDLNNAIRTIMTYIENENKISLCVDIDIDRDRVRILEQMNLSEKENSIASLCPEIKRYWDYDRNGKITPEMIPHASNKQIFLKCERGHTWDVTASNFPSHPWCPFCSGRKVLTGFNDLFTTNPELIPFWSINNTIDPRKIKRGSNLKAFWVCPNCKGEYHMKVADKAKGQGCPYCSGHRVLKGYNDLATLQPDLVKDWNYEKNSPLLPEEVTKGSNKKVWWKCHVCKHEWRAIVYDRAVLKRKCPECKRKNPS